VSYRAAIIDDEELAIKRLRRMLAVRPEIEVVGEASNVRNGVACVKANKVDLAFLDIHLPDGTGFDVLQQLGSEPPLVVFTTGYDKYALQAFEAAGIDYLLKPVEPEHLARALQKLERLANKADRAGFEGRLKEWLHGWTAPAPNTASYVQKLTVRLGERALLVDLSEVGYFDAKDKYVFMHTTAGKEYIVEHTLAELEAKLDPKRFVRVHRSTIVNADQIREIQNWFGGKYRLLLRDKSSSELVVSKGMAANLRAIVSF
jgi:two-component system LytT family response regulator